MKSILRNSITVLLLALVTYGCDTGSNSGSKKPVVKKADSKTLKSKKSTTQQSKLPPGESLNRTTKGFRDTKITMDTDLNLLRLQGE